jgi:membrane protein implicated in regulation of membrane protease activity
MVLMPIVMLLPVIALPIFWLLPFRQALWIYIFCLALFGFMFWIMMKTMRLPVITGRRSLIGRDGEVISKKRSVKGEQYIIRVNGELWSACNNESMQPGDTVRITAVKGNSIFVERKDTVIQQET